MRFFEGIGSANVALWLSAALLACGSSGEPASEQTAGAGGAAAGGVSSGGSVAPANGGTTGGVSSGGRLAVAPTGGASPSGGSGAGTGGAAPLGGESGGGNGNTVGGGGALPVSGGGPSAGGASGAAGSGGASTDSRDLYFKDWPPGADPKAVGDRLAPLFLAEPVPTVEEQKKHYKLACAWYGSLAVSALLQNQTRLDALIARYDSYEGTWGGIGAGHVDKNVFGIVPLEIALHSDDPLYAQEGLALADNQIANIQTQKRFAIDDMFMITALQVQAYRVSKKPAYLDTAASVMVEYLNRLQQPDGLFFHHQDFEHKWGRGNGWFAAGMAELIRELPPEHPNAAAVRQGYESMMSGLLGYQVKDGGGAGLWKQIVDSTDTRNWPETSGSAMFTYALVSGVRAGWLDPDTFGPAARAGWLAVVAKLDAQGKLQDISDWAYKPESHAGEEHAYDGDFENYYFARPKLTGDNHGQAPVLWSAAELLR